MRSSAGARSMSLAMLLAVAIPPEAASASETLPFGRPWGMANQATITTRTTLLDLRGGGLFGGKKSAARIYRESLEEQVLLLNEQLSHARTEVATLRENAKKRHQSGSSLHRAKPVAPPTKAEERAASKQEDKLEKQRLKDQKETLARLQKEIKSLEKMKADLEKLLETSAQKIEQLEAQLADQESLTARTEASYKDQIAKLEAQLAKLQASQEAQLTKLQQEKIDAAVQEALRAQEAEFRAQMEETTRRLTKEHALLMEQEKLRSSKAVETERKKMRKLVRALALREKKLKLASPPEASKKKKETTTINTKTTTPTKQFVPPTSRGKI